jgi:predicted Zn-dependent peptidase
VTPEPARPTPLALAPCERVQLDSGMAVLLVERRALPLTTFEVVVRAGASLDPPGMEGLAASAFGTLRKGTERRSAEEFSAAIDSMGALFGTSVDQDHGHIAAEFLSRDAEAGLSLVAEALLAPTYPEGEVAKRLSQATDAIRDDKDFPPAVIGRYYESALFDGHPYGRPVGGDERSLARIARDDVAAFHAAHVAPESMVLAIAGAFDAPRMVRLVESAFRARVPRAAAASPAPTPLPAVAPARGRRVVLVDKPDEEMAYFRFGNVGIAFGDPRWVLLNLARTVLGGSFTSWLNTALRVDEGLTYGVQADLSRRRCPGPFSISSYARVDRVERALDIALGQLRRIHDEGIDDATLRLAKNYVKGQFPLAIETADQIAEAYARFEAYGVPRQWIAEYLALVEGASADEVSEVARDVFPRDDLVFAMIGRAEALAPVAERLGPTTRRSLTEPGF